MKGLKAIVGSVVVLLCCALARAQAPDLSNLANVYKVDFILVEPGAAPNHISAIVREGANSTVEVKAEGAGSTSVKVEFSVVEDQEQSARTGNQIAQIAAKVSKKNGDEWKLIGQPEILMIIGAQQPSRMSVGDRYSLTAAVSKVASDRTPARR